MVPAEYKKTEEFGIIPRDWQLTNIGSLQPFVTSGSRGWAAYYSNFGAPFIRITNINRESIYLNLSSMRYVNIPETENEGKRTELHDGDIIISITADIGIIGYIDQYLEKPAYINQHIALVRFKPEKISSKFIAYFLAGRHIQTLFRGATDQGAKAGINLETLRGIQIALPDYLEQKAIAQALSDVDALITSLEKILIKKSGVKTATMQQLLTGQTRLPGFGEGKEYKKTDDIGIIPEDWNIKSLGDFISLQRGYDLTSRERRPGNIPVMGAAGQNGFHNESLVSGPGIVLGRSGASFGQVHYCKSDYWPHNTGLYATDFHGNNILFTFYFLSSIDFSQYNSGGAQQSLNRNFIYPIVIATPDLEEQQTIARALSDIDDDIATLESRLKKTKALKQGMMQELLTGRTRLV